MNSCNESRFMLIYPEVDTLMTPISKMKYTVNIFKLNKFSKLQPKKWESGNNYFVKRRSQNGQTHKSKALFSTHA